ncbi:sulfatase-like hydrolase/transferase [uncultured Sphaerochaeta sp.]|uniref:sulfatase-like hydrolase/transferase n=1 Tax=uncultured Sphaerochaeta sp. TaxID=886478 RepID=UPI002A0A6320|nr:sulfatase-like hydrolase/transferase [uncultured Sphaerochaeta sp.]
MKKNRPNFIVIMTDDQGYGDLSCMGATDLRTPNIDRLAHSGARFTNWYSNCPVCSPSRASLLTGCYPANAGVRSIISGHRKASGILPETPTIAQALKDIGYSTSLVGKWHLGLQYDSRPNQNGFDYFYGFMAGCIDYYSHIFYWSMADGNTNPTHDLWENDKAIYDNGEYFTEMVTEKSVERIREMSMEDKPFFLYVAYNAPHYPLHAPKKYLDRFPELPPDRRIMAAMLSAVDDGVGDILDELERRNILEDTVVFFQSDNGPSRESRNWMDGTPDPYYGGMPGSLKGNKFSLFEGGIRVPGIFSWPEHISAGQVIDEPCVAMDVFPTMLKLAGGNPDQYRIDGTDILPVLEDGAKSPHDYIFWEMENQTAVRHGNYKLVLNGRLVEKSDVEAPVFLTDLSKDEGETHNLVDEMPDMAEDLRQIAEAWRTGIEKTWEDKSRRNKNIT